MPRIFLKGGIVMATMERSACPGDQDVTAVQGGAAYLPDIERRLAPDVERAEPRQRALASLRGLLSPAERQNSWPLAAVSGDATPDGLQHLRRRARWDPEAVRDERRREVVQHLGDAAAGLVLDETGVLNKGRHSAGVARQYRGTAGRMEHGQIGVFVGDASRPGHTLRDRERSLPAEWTTDRARCQQAGLPADRGFATKPALAQEMLPRTLAAGVPARWVTGDRVDGDDRRLRLWLDAQPQAPVLAVSGKAYVWLDVRPRQVKTILAALPTEGWPRLRAGEGAKGPRWDDWRWLPVAEPLEPNWRRWLLVRRRVSASQDLPADVVLAPQETPLAEVVRVAGTRWTLAQLFDAAQGEVGLDHDEVRSWTGWFRHLTLARWALARLTVLRAGASALEAFKKSLPSRTEDSRLAVFKARRGLISR
jgi:SRSO17 transposase